MKENRSPRGFLGKVFNVSRFTRNGAAREVSTMLQSHRQIRRKTRHEAAGNLWTGELHSNPFLPPAPVFVNSALCHQPYLKRVRREHGSAAGTRNTEIGFAEASGLPLVWQIGKFLLPESSHVEEGRKVAQLPPGSQHQD